MRRKVIPFRYDIGRYIIPGASVKRVSPWAIARYRQSMTEARRHAPATLRNRDPILAVLRDVLPARGRVLEVASGSGEHAVYFARALPDLAWLPSDPSPEARASIAVWRQEEGSANLQPPVALDAADEAWPVDHADAIVCINMIHISPWAATLGLMRGAGRILPAGAPLVLYGPFVIDGSSLAPSNAAFDADLKARDPRWGLRDLDTVCEVASAHGLLRESVVAMPANNLMLVLRRR
jgi:SAM-dependent methyltransferase